jgi:hypothetical protein
MDKALAGLICVTERCAVVQHWACPVLCSGAGTTDTYLCNCLVGREFAAAASLYCSILRMTRVKLTGTCGNPQAISSCRSVVAASSRLKGNKLFEPVLELIIAGITMH